MFTGCPGDTAEEAGPGLALFVTSVLATVPLNLSLVSLGWGGVD